MTGHPVPPRIDRPAAAAGFRKNRGWIRRWLARNGCRARKMERVALPQRMVRERADERLLIAVDLHSERAAIWEPAGLVWLPELVEAEFPCLVDAEQVIAAARTALTLRRRAFADLECAETILFPFWVEYRAARDGTIGFEMLDAVTGRPAGMAVKQGFVKALKARNRRIPGNPRDGVTAP